MHETTAMCLNESNLPLGEGVILQGNLQIYYVSPYEAYLPMVTDVGISLKGKVDVLGRFQSEITHNGVTLFT